jgi:hypothetical protein
MQVDPNAMIAAKVPRLVAAHDTIRYAAGL